jgi:hypothetical protein
VDRRRLATLCGPTERQRVALRDAGSARDGPISRSPRDARTRTCAARLRSASGTAGLRRARASGSPPGPCSTVGCSSAAPFSGRLRISGTSSRAAWARCRPTYGRQCSTGCATSCGAGAASPRCFVCRCPSPRAACRRWRRRFGTRTQALTFAGHVAEALPIWDSGTERGWVFWASPAYVQAGRRAEVEQMADREDHPLRLAAHQCCARQRRPKLRVPSRGDRDRSSPRVVVAGRPRPGGAPRRSSTRGARQEAEPPDRIRLLSADEHLPPVLQH